MSKKCDFDQCIQDAAVLCFQNNRQKYYCEEHKIHQKADQENQEGLQEFDYYSVQTINLLQNHLEKQKIAITQDLSTIYEIKATFLKQASFISYTLNETLLGVESWLSSLKNRVFKHKSQLCQLLKTEIQNLQDQLDPMDEERKIFFNQKKLNSLFYTRGVATKTTFEEYGHLFDSDSDLSLPEEEKAFQDIQIIESPTPTSERGSLRLSFGVLEGQQSKFELIGYYGIGKNALTEIQEAYTNLDGKVEQNMLDEILKILFSRRRGYIWEYSKVQERPELQGGTRYISAKINDQYYLFKSKRKRNNQYQESNLVFKKNIVNH